MRRLLVAFGLTLLAGPAWAMTATPTGTIVRVDYDEPSENEPDAAGLLTPLDDLAETRVLFQIGTDPAVVCATVPARVATGGSHVSTPCTVPAGPKRRTTVALWAVAVDTSGNVSAPSPTVTVVIDRLAPGPPR